MSSPTTPAQHRTRRPATSSPLELNATPARCPGRTRLMRPRRAAQPPAAPAGSARSTIGAVAHRGEDPPHNGGIAADSVQRGVIIWRPASRSRFSGLAFDDLDDVEGSHVRHDPPPPRPAQGREPLPPPRHPGPALRAPGPATGDGIGRIFPPIGAESAMRIQIPDRGFALSGTARRPAPAEPLIGARRRVARGDGRQGEADARHHVEW